MIAFLFRRLLQGVAILVTVATVTFALVHAQAHRVAHDHGLPFQAVDARQHGGASHAQLTRQVGGAGACIRLQ